MLNHPTWILRYLIITCVSIPHVRKSNTYHPWKSSHSSRNPIFVYIKPKSSSSFVKSSQTIPNNVSSALLLSSINGIHLYSPQGQHSLSHKHLHLLLRFLTTIYIWTCCSTFLHHYSRSGVTLIPYLPKPPVIAFPPWHLWDFKHTHVTRRIARVKIEALGPSGTSVRYFPCWN